jgi:hypothetical protein
MNSNNNYNPYPYFNINHNHIASTQVYYNHTINPVHTQTKNVIYGGNTILRNGSNSYRPLPITPTST